jgi:hypothetical protein
MTTEKDDNKRHGLLDPDVIHGMWKNTEPLERKIELNLDFLMQQEKYTARKLTQEERLTALLKMKGTLSREEIVATNTLGYLSSIELKERTNYYIESLRKQLVKVKDELYSPENKNILEKLKNRSQETSVDESHSVFEMQADEAIWLLSKATIFKVKSKTADLLYDLNLLYSWSHDQNRLSSNVKGNQSQAVASWLSTLNYKLKMIQCSHCKNETFIQFDFCSHCYHVF